MFGPPPSDVCRDLHVLKERIQLIYFTMQAQLSLTFTYIIIVNIALNWHRKNKSMRSIPAVKGLTLLHMCRASETFRITEL